MKAISLFEPYATAMALGLKENETRSWPTSHRGDLVICATKRAMDPWMRELCQRVGIPLNAVAHGCAVCVVELYAVDRSDGFKARNPIEKALGDYTGGRFIWRTRNLRRLAKPVPVRGKQGLFELQIDLGVEVGA